MNLLIKNIEKYEHLNNDFKNEEGCGEFENIILYIQCLKLYYDKYEGNKGKQDYIVKYINNLINELNDAFFNGDIFINSKYYNYMEL